MFQNIIRDNRDGNDEIEIIPYTTGECGNEEYMLDVKNNDLYKIDANYKCDFLAEPGFRKGENRYEYMGMVQNKDSFILIPNTGAYFTIYNIREKSKRYIEVKKDIYIYDFGKPGFNKFIDYKNKIFLIRDICNYIVSIDRDTLEINYIQIFDEAETDFNLFRTSGDCYRYKYQLYIPILETNRILILNMDNNRFEIRRLEKDVKIATLCGFESTMYAVGANGIDVCVIDNTEWKITAAYKVPAWKGLLQDIGSNEWQFVFVGSFYYNGYIWLIPFALSNMIVRIKAGTIETECVYLHEMFVVWNYRICGDELWMFTDTGVKKVNLDTGVSIPLKYCLSDNCIAEYISAEMEKESVVNEKGINLRHYLKWLLTVSDKQITEDRFHNEKKQKDIYWYL